MKYNNHLKIDKCILFLTAMIIMTLTEISPTQAEPPINAPPIVQSLLNGGLIVGGAIGKTLEKLNPSCSQELEKCWVSHGLNKDNEAQVSDTCWRETKKCPTVCKDKYFARRQAGMSPAAADPLFEGTGDEATSCVSGPDKLTQQKQKLKASNSTLVQSKKLNLMPDLMPVVMNANQGTFEIRNIGKKVAKPSQVIVVCSRLGATAPSTYCAAGLDLPNYTKKWNILSYDIPTLQPGSSYRIKLFGDGALPRRSGNYAMKVTIDPSKRIAESNESNNYTRLDTVIGASDKYKGGVQLTVLMNGKPVKAAIVISRLRQRTILVMPPAERKRKMKQTPFELPLPAGKYYLSVYVEIGSPLKIYLHMKALPIEIKKEKWLKKTLIIPSGRMKLSTTFEGKKTTGVKVNISGFYNNFEYFSARAALSTPVDIRIPAGKYKIKAWNKEGQRYHTATLNIKSGSTVNHVINFDKLRTGYLKLNLLIEGKSIPFEMGRSSRREGFLYNVSLFSADTGEPARLFTPGNIKPVKLRAGVYDIKIHENAIAGKNILIKKVAIREGETVEKTVAVEQPGELNIQASWTHQPVNLIACAVYYNPINLNRLGALMGGGSGAGARSRGDCFSSEVILEASVSSPGRSDGDIAKIVYPRVKLNKNTDGTINSDRSIRTINFNSGVYDVAIWPVGHRELKQMLKGIEIKSGRVIQKKLEFHWPGKKK